VRRRGGAQERALADAGLAGDQSDAAVRGRVLQQLAQRPEGVGAFEEVGHARRV
jgi:hypothetical protein